MSIHLARERGDERVSGYGLDLLSKHSHLSFTIEINYLCGTTGKTKQQTNNNELEFSRLAFSFFCVLSITLTRLLLLWRSGRRKKSFPVTLVHVCWLLAGTIQSPSRTIIDRMEIFPYPKKHTPSKVYVASPIHNINIKYTTRTA